MARLAPEEGFEVLKDRVSGAVKAVFPIEGKKHTLRLDDIEVKDDKDIEDLRSQKKARLEGRTWSVPVNAKMSLVDNATGKIVDKRKQRIMNLPKVTNRHSYIVDGQEYQLDNQWQLKPGVYSRRNERGDLESMFNLKGRSAFKLQFDPKTSKFMMQKGSTHIPAYPLMRELGVSDEELEKGWGKQILAANKGTNPEKAFEQFYKATQKEPSKNPAAAKSFLHEFMDGAKMDPNVAKLTLGDAHDTVGGGTMRMASEKLLGISRGKVKPDDRDSLMFKNFRSAEDFLDDAITQRSGDIMRRVGNNLDRKKKIGEIVVPDVFNKPVHTMFTKANLSNRPDQTNPLEMISGAMKTTIMGEGGVKSEHKIIEDAKLVNPSHLGFLDPIHTPEGSRAGVTLHLPLGATKKGNDVQVRMYNTKTGKMEGVNPEKAYHSTIAFPDQVKWTDGKPKAVGKAVKMSGPENEIVEGDLKKADYVMAAPAQLFSVASNMIPFMQNTSGNRSTMAGRHMEQAIPLKHREKPLVQTVIQAGNRETSLNKFMGKLSSQKAPVSGEVVQIKKDGIIVQGADGKKKEVQTYDHFPLNDDKSFMHSTPSVKVGDKVRKGQTVADTNFTKGGELALGANLRAAYMPFHGYNFEDGVVISETAAKKMTSEHMHRKGVDMTKEHKLSKKEYIAHFGSDMNKEQAEKLDDDAVIKPGTSVKPGDVLIGAMRNRVETDETRIKARMHKSLLSLYDNVGVKWEGDHPGTVTNVVKRGKRTEVHVKTEEPAEIGDKLAGRHGNKGIITKIVPDHDMPKTGDDRPAEILLNPAGVPGRLNLGQLMETSAAKIAEKTGRTYKAQNFDGTADQTDKLKKELKANGLTDKEVMFDKNGKKLGKVLVGPHYIQKLKHQVGKKLVARAGGPGYVYDMNRMPKGGGPNSAQALDSLGVYAMLAHGAKTNLREMQTYKSNAENNDELWSAIQSGNPLPPPRPTFAYTKFTGMLKAIGVNTVKQGNSLQLMPLTDKDVKELSNGEIKDAGRMVIGKNLKEEKGGLFDPTSTGGLEGDKWSHIKLPEAMPNPIFEKSIVSLTGLKQKDFDSLMDGSKALDTKTGKIVSPEDGVSAGKAIGHLLKKIDVDKDLAAAQALLKSPGLKDNRLDQVNRKVKYLQNLKKLDMKPTDAYMSKYVPVMPPSMRPLTARPDGSLAVEDLNGMYKGLGVSVRQFKQCPPGQLPEEFNKRRGDIYDSMKALTGVGGNMNRKYRGVLDIIRGKKLSKDSPGEKVGGPRESYFQSKLIKRKQDMSMRSTIIPEPELGLDEVGIPKKAAMEIYKPFIVKELRGLTGMSPLAAQNAIKDNDPLAQRALERVAEKRPLLLKRDPVLHKYGVQAFKPVLTSGKAVKIHPLVTSGYNADFDGDTMSAFVPLSEEAVDEAHKMYPSRNLFSPATGDLMYRPTHEGQLGLFALTQDGKRSNKAFKTVGEAAKAAKDGGIGLTDSVKIGSMRTTVGRALVANALPKELRNDVLKGKTPLNGKDQEALLSRVARDHKGDYGTVSNKIKDLGNEYATSAPISIGLDDIKPDKKLRDRVLSVADKKVGEIMAGPGKKQEKLKKVVQTYDKASEAMVRGAELTHGKNPSALYTMMKAGVKPNMGAYRQITMAPMLMMNAKGETIPTPIRKSYAEGLDVGDYWTSMSGARKGVIQKTQAVQEPGYFTKQVINSTMNVAIGENDCGTKKGISLPIEERDVLDRFLASDVKAGRKKFKSGTLVTPGVRDSLRNNKVRRVVVRSPLRCEHGDGLCAKCYGLDEDGTEPQNGKNVGIISAQTLGERSTQLAMRTFHEGGVAPVGGSAKQKAVLTDEFNRVQQLVQMPKHVPGAATLSGVSGKVTKIQKDPAGGHNVFVGTARHYVPQNRGDPIAFVGDRPRKLAKGMQIQKGSPLSTGPINPNEMLPLTGINKVQGHLASELYGLYKNQGIRRRNVETVVKSMTNLTKVQDPGGHGEYIRGDFAPTSRVQALNKRLAAGKKKPIVHTPVLKGVKTLPLDMQTDWMARLNHENLGATVIEASNKGWSSNIHGNHPIPALAYGAEFGKKKPY